MSILRVPAVLNRTGLSRASLYRFIAVNDFPSQIALGKRAIGFLESEVNDWIASRVAARRKRLQ
jgi:prophage regulatory protein